MDTYKTLGSAAEGLYKEKGSRFLAFAYPIASDGEVKELVGAIKKKYYDARHHCYAYRLGAEGEQFRAVDDGEPSGTAGRPILGQLLSAELTNTLIVVVRYFGGIKLGVGGLIQAYKEAAADAIAAAEIVEKTVDAHYKIEFPYIVMNDVMKIVKDLEPRIIEQTFEMNCEIVLAVRRRDEQVFGSRIEDVEGVHREFLGYI